VTAHASTGAPSGRASTLPTSFGYKPTLDGLRAVAVLSVIAFHFGTGQLPGGFLGVDTFFVLSGYLITSLLLVEWGRSSRINFGAFWARRARRLLPALFIVLIAIGIWSMLAVSTDQLSTIRSDGLWTLFYAANWHFIHAGQSYFALVSNASPLRHAWSLAIEEQFYLVWPLLTFACLKLGKGRTGLLTGLCAVGAVASATEMGLLFVQGNPNRAYYGTDCRAQGLLIGALVAIFLAHRAGRPLPRAVQLVGVAGAVVCVWMFAVAGDTASWMYPWGFVLFEVSTAAVILAMTQPVRTPLHELLSLRPVRWVGQISYGLYLWHWPVSVAISAGNTRLTGWELLVARLVVTFGAAVLSYYLVELPIRHGTFLKGWGSKLAAPIGFATAASVLLVGTAGATAPPRYLVASPNQVLTTGSGHTKVPPSTAAGQDPALAINGPVLLVGDSVADTLSGSLRDTAASHGVTLTAAVRPGCGLNTGAPVAPDGTTIAWGKACSDATPGYEVQVAQTSGAKVVVALSTWEDADRIVNGQLVKFGTPAGDQLWFRLLDEMRARLTANGARLLLVKMPPPAKFSDLGPADPDAVHRMVLLGALYQRYTALHRDVGLVDLSTIVCPSGPPCPEFVAGIRLRPADGGHYQAPGAAWVTPRLYAAIAAASR
jgi:peptidoglycan/LPS O-acetylase OafA/YrhL